MGNGCWPKGAGLPSSRSCNTGDKKQKKEKEKAGRLAQDARFRALQRGLEVLTVGGVFRGGVSKTLDVIRSKNGGKSTGTPEVSLWVNTLNRSVSHKKTESILHTFNGLRE